MNPLFLSNFYHHEITGSRGQNRAWESIEPWLHPSLLVLWKRRLKSVSCSVLSDSLRLSSRLLCPWDSPGKNTGVGSHSLFQGDLPGPGIKLGSPALAGRLFTVWVARVVLWAMANDWTSLRPPNYNNNNNNKYIYIYYITGILRTLNLR